MCGIPWIADFRDTWDISIQRNELPREKCIEAEKSILKSCAAIITVSPLLQQLLQRRHSKPCYTVYNGFDETPEGKPVESSKSQKKALSICYLGSLYYPEQDPRAFFEAIESILESCPTKGRWLELRFSSRHHESISEIIKPYTRLRACTTITPHLPHSEALKLQKEADILVLFTLVGDKGVPTSKLFEYLGARRTILCYPGDQDIVSEILTETAAGYVCSNRSQLEVTLRQLFVEFEMCGAVQWNGRPDKIAKYNRENQTRALVEVLDAVERNSH
jgi:hypothetical protein